MLTFNVILTNEINLKYLTGLLNSDLIAFWLKYQGKMQGDLYQVDKAPLMNLPILKPTEEKQNEVGILVTQIIEGNQKQHDYTALLKTALESNNFDREIQLTKELSETNKTIITAENEINNIIFSLYQMQPEDIASIKKNII